MARPRRVPNPESRVPSAISISTDDARAGETIVKAASIACEQGGEKSEASRRRQEQPHGLSHQRMADVECGRRLGCHDPDARRHLAEGLPSRCEGDEVSAVLHEEKRN